MSYLGPGRTGMPVIGSRALAGEGHRWYAGKTMMLGLLTSKPLHGLGNDLKVIRTKARCRMVSTRMLLHCLDGYKIGTQNSHCSV